MTAIFAYFFEPAARWLRRLGVCGNAGVIVGTLAGLLLFALDFIHGGGLALSVSEAVRIALLLAAAGWLVLLFVFTAFGRASLASVAVPAAVNSLLVCTLTVLLTRALGLYPVAVLVGIVIGMAIGAALCTLYNRAGR